MPPYSGGLERSTTGKKTLLPAVILFVIHGVGTMGTTSIENEVVPMKSKTPGERTF